MINLSTGPVGILPNVMDALFELPVSHRSPDFQNFTSKAAELFCSELKVKRTYFLTGSGTLGNEVMIQQAKLNNRKGIILINGEFGRRLAEQATLANAEYIKSSIEWGDEFDINEVEQLIITENIGWIMFCHNETSAGLLNPLAQLGEISKKHRLKAYVDCMSSVGTMPIDLSNITMATASSGKGQGSVAGIALVFSNELALPTNTIPRYLDIGVYEQKNGVPFTIASNLLKALGVGAQNNINTNHWDKLDKFSDIIFDALAPLGVIPFAKRGTRVFNIVPKNMKSTELEERLLALGIILSCRSEYLISRNWIQLALFGHYSEEEIKMVAKEISSLLKS